MLTHTSSHTSDSEQIRIALQGVHGLALLKSVLDDHAAQAVLALLHALSAAEVDPLIVAHSYSHALRALASAVNEDMTPALSDAWQAYLIGRLIADSNMLSVQVERVGATHVAPALYSQMQKDIRVLQRLFALSADMIWEWTCKVVVPTLPALQDAWIPWLDLAPVSKEEAGTARSMLVKRIAESADWAELVQPLAEYWERHGTGLFARYTALRWQGVVEGLQSIAHPDTIQLSNLIGYQREQDKLRANIQRFVAGVPAHDMLLYGAPGTGKSSTVKALVNAYADQGLRLVEVRKEFVGDLPGIVAQLRGRAPRFLLFIDDLSFEEHETAYKVLKMLLEGTAEARPGNILVCATSNRQNLIRENFSDRGKPSDDVNWRDTMDEKLSLVHRFGLRVTFTLPDQERYLAIVLGLAQQRGITLPEDTLKTRALQWERQHVGRSGRLARQFVDELIAEQELRLQ